MRVDPDGVIIEDVREGQLVPVPPSAVAAPRRFDVAPVLTVKALVERRRIVEEVVSEVMEDGIHYGTIPGTPQAGLWKDGAELLCTVFGLAPSYRTDDADLDFTGERHNGEQYIGYTVTCELYREGYMVGSGSGSCSSWERKYRWSGQKQCPECGVAAIYRSKNADGGWYCWAKKGGCGATFEAEDPRIGTQGDGRTPNPDVFDLQNTILKMAQKRALIAAVGVVTGAHSVIVRMSGGKGGQAPAPRANGQAAASAAGPKPAGCTCAGKQHFPTNPRCPANGGGQAAAPTSGRQARGGKGPEPPPPPHDQAHCSQCGVAPLTAEQILGDGMCGDCSRGLAEEAKAAMDADGWVDPDAQEGGKLPL